MSNENYVSPDIDCPSCGGEGVDADPYGLFDYDCIKPCPDCHAIEQYTEERMNDAYGRIHTDGSRSGGQPLIANRKAHTMIIEVLATWGIEPSNTTPEQLTIATTEALCRAIKQIEDLRHDLERQMTIANEHVNEVERLREALAHIAFSGADGPYGHFGEALNEHQMRRVAKATLQEQSK